LLEEGLRKPYYGMNISRGKEPLDQLDMFFLAKKLGVPLTVFVAGQYGLLNGKVKPEEITAKEAEKKKLLEAAFRVFGVEVTILLTSDLWTKESYWETVAELSGTKDILEKGASVSFSEAVARYPEAFPQNSGLGKALASIGSLPAAGTYTLLEVAEARFLQKELGIDTKLGPESVFI